MANKRFSPKAASNTALTTLEMIAEHFTAIEELLGDGLRMNAEAGRLRSVAITQLEIAASMCNKAVLVAHEGDTLANPDPKVV